MPDDLVEACVQTIALAHNSETLFLQTVSEIIAEMDDNLCRCGSYNRIVDAIQTAAAEMMEL